MTPSVARMVHFVADDRVKCRAAVVTAVHGDGDPERETRIDLAVLNPAGLFFAQNVAESGLIENTAMYPAVSWHWPERIPE